MLHAGVQCRSSAVPLSPRLPEGSIKSSSVQRMWGNLSGSAPCFHITLPPWQPVSYSGLKYAYQLCDPGQLHSQPMEIILILLQKVVVGKKPVHGQHLPTPGGQCL